MREKDIQIDTTIESESNFDERVGESERFQRQRQRQTGQRKSKKKIEGRGKWKKRIIERTHERVSMCTWHPWKDRVSLTHHMSHTCACIHAR